MWISEKKTARLQGYQSLGNPAIFPDGSPVAFRPLFAQGSAFPDFCGFLHLLKTTYCAIMYTKYVRLFSLKMSMVVLS
jgi:hypothetical protein